MKNAILLVAAAAMAFATPVAAHEAPACDRAGLVSQVDRCLAALVADDMPAMHIPKLWDGQIYEIEALGFIAAYKTPTGWEE